MKSSFILLLAVLLPITGEAADAQTPDTPTIVEMAPVNLGRVRSDQPVQHGLTLQNRTDTPLKITSVRLHGEGIKAKLPSNIPAGEAGTIDVLIDPANLLGDWKWGVEVETNNPRAKLVLYTIQASVYPPIEFLPSRSVYFSLYSDQSKNKRITIRNHSDTPFTIQGFEKSADFFEVLLLADEGKDMALDISVPESVPLGRHQETLTLLTDHPERPRMRVPINILIKSDIYASVDGVGFGKVNLENFKNNASVRELLTQTVILTSRERAFTVTAIDTVLPFLKVEVASGPERKTHRLDFSLDPQTLEPGRFSDRIIVKTDDPKHPEIAVPVSGEVR